mgnify:CR=1 FL=1
MYKCSKCNLGIIMIPNQEPIRVCSCKKEDGSLATIIIDISATAEGKSRFAQK